MCVHFHNTLSTLKLTHNNIQSATVIKRNGEETCKHANANVQEGQRLVATLTPVTFINKLPVQLIC